MKQQLTLVLVTLAVGLMLGALLMDRFRPAPKCPDTSSLAAQVDSLELETAALVEQRNKAASSAQLWQEEVALARRTRQTANKDYPIHAKAAYDSGLDALRDSLMQGAGD